MAKTTADFKIEPPFYVDVNCGTDIRKFEAGIKTEKQEAAEEVTFVPIVFEEETTPFPQKRAAAESEEDLPPKKKPARSSSTETCYLQETRASEPTIANVELDVESPHYGKAKSLEHERESPIANTQDGTGQRHTPAEVARASDDPNLASTEATPRSPNPKRNQAHVKPKRTPASKAAEKVVLPTKWSKASQADETLVSMKESGYSWNELREKWTELTGQVTASSTLPNRYKRLQLIMMELRDTEKEILVAAKQAVEDNWKTMMWSAISTKMEAMGARKFPPEFLCKEFKNIEKEADKLGAARYAGL
ncbi:MAG: hypothetical protein Q9221_005256 [Calogaya cf. arnoldii]